MISPNSDGDEPSPSPPQQQLQLQLLMSTLSVSKNNDTLHNDDTGRHILKFVGKHQYRFIGSISKQYNRLYNKEFNGTTTSYNNIATEDQAEIWYFDFDGDFEYKKLLKYAVGIGNIILLQCLPRPFGHHLDYDDERELCKLAAGNGHLDMLQYLHETLQFSWNLDTREAAYENGHYHCAAYTHEKGIYMP